MKKKYFISVDLEGVACAVGLPGQGLGANDNYAFACRQGSREANAAAKALYDCGAEEVYVWDCHGTGVNLDYDMFDPRCKFVIGSGSKKRFPGIDEDFGGIVYIGYHAYDTPNATLAHVYSSSSLQHYKVNGEYVGELEIDSAIAGKYGVAPIFVSGDDILTAQAKKSFPGIVTVETKKALAWNSCISKHPQAVCEEIYEGVKRSLKADTKPYLFTDAFECEIRFKRIEFAQSCSLRDINGEPFRVIDAYTRAGTLAKPEDIFY